MRTFLLFTTIILFTGCSLNAEQERTLNKSLSNYLSSHNQLESLGMLSYVHPSVIKWYKNQGDDVFQKRFKLVDENGYCVFWTDPILKKVKSRSKTIHVKYQLKALPEEGAVDSPLKINIIACSDDNGVHWFFVDEKDYFNPLIFSTEKQLISKND